MATEVDRPNPNTTLTYDPAREEQLAPEELKTYLRSAFTRTKNMILRQPWRDYMQSLGLVVLVTLLGLPFGSSLDHANIVMLYLLTEVIAATRFGLGPSIVAALASVIAYHYFFILPRFTFAVDEAQYLLTFTGLLIVGLVISTLTSRVREQAKTAERREAQTAASYDLSQALATTVALEDITEAIMSHVKRVFKREVVILLPDRSGLSLYTLNPDFSLDEHEHAVAAWVFQNGQPAGRGTQTLPAIDIRYHPLKTVRGVVGVLGIKPSKTREFLTSEQYRLLEIFVSQAAVAIERTQLAEQARQAQLLREKEKLQTALLNSISHDLRTPLASITGVLSSLSDDAAYLDSTTQSELIQNAREEADRMNRLVANLLDITRLEAQAIKVVREPGDIQDVVGVALNELADRLKDRPVIVDIPADLPLVPIDFVLIVRLLTNLLDNAQKYSLPGSPIEIRARPKDKSVEIEVADRGVGIPSDELTRVFEKFYRVSRTNDTGGTGLGLSICKGIIEVHGGRIWAQNRPGGGTRFILTLPLSLEQTGAAATEVF